MKPPSSFESNRKVSKKLVNNFFERRSEKENFDSEDLHTNKWSVDCWLGFRIFPLVEHSLKDEEKNYRPKKMVNRKIMGGKNTVNNIVNVDSAMYWGTPKRINKALSPLL